MKYTRFIIKNYKAINELTIDLFSNVIPLIGINESGKTTILQAILAFDKDKDNVLNGNHLFAKNKYRTVQSQCELKACFVLENEEEFQEIGEEIHLKMDDPLYSWLKYCLDNSQEICLQRDYTDYAFQKTYRLVNAPEEVRESSKEAQLVRALIKRLPFILYYDDFSDRVPESVVFPEKYTYEKQLARGVQREWQEIIIEIFKRALNEEFSLSHFLELTDEDDRDNYLSDVEDTLNRDIIEEWRRLKQQYAISDTEDDDLKLKIKYYLEDGKPTFKFKVIDNEFGGSDRYFDVNQRSKGFQWFFNFIMKLKYNPKYNLSPKNAIFLLDEPGSYLHASAQRELLKKLCDLGENNTIIYCTHSQYLLDPEIINIADIRIVDKADGSIRLYDYGNYPGTRSLGAFSALNDALHLKFGLHERMLKKCILTEGITEFYFYKMFFGFTDDINVIPGHGCGHLKELIAILISCSDSFVVVLDNDPEGRSNYNTYEHYYKDSFTRRCYQYDGVGKKNDDFELEDILSSNDKERIINEVGYSDIKKAIILLFFMDDERKRQIIRAIDDETKNNISIIKRKITELLEQ